LSGIIAGARIECGVTAKEPMYYMVRSVAKSDYQTALLFVYDKIVFYRS
jgi:hypothetical protein